MPVKVGIPPQVFAMGTQISMGGVLLALMTVIVQRRRI